MAQKEIITARDWASQSEEHARTALRAYRYSLSDALKQRAAAHEQAARAMETINEVKQVLYEKGWTE